MNLLSFAASHIDGYNLFLGVLIGSIAGIIMIAKERFYKKEKFQEFAKDAERVMASLVTILIGTFLIVTMEDHAFGYVFFGTVKIMVFFIIGVITGSSFCSFFSDDLLEKIFFWEIPRMRKRRTS